MRHIAAILSLCLCVTASALAQETRSVPLVGVLMINTPANAEPIASLFRNALAALGYAEGRNLRLDFRFAEGHVERFPALAEALVTEKADVIVALGDAPTRAAQQATRTIPIVAIAAGGTTFRPSARPREQLFRATRCDRRCGAGSRCRAADRGCPQPCGFRGGLWLVSDRWRRGDRYSRLTDAGKLPAGARPAQP